MSKGVFSSRNIDCYWFRHPNVGDTLGPVLIESLTDKIVTYSENAGKLITVGSIITQAKEGDTIWGSGLIRDIFVTLPKVNVLALRGPLTAHRCNLDTDVYGDPGILMSRIYQPKTQKIYDRGYTPHYIDQDIFKQKPLKENELFIDVLQPHYKVIDQINQCKEIVSSSLHGIVLAESYGIPAIYTKYSDNVIGGEFKFKDYLLGTGRTEDVLHNQPIPPIENLKERQDLLIELLKDYVVTRY